jgi:hypothetical protein
VSNRCFAEEARAALATRLRQRRPEIEQSVVARVYGISEPTESTDPEYLKGLHAALSSALEFGFAVIERGEERAPPVPTALLAQARLAARNGIPIETVLRRYFAGYGVLSEFLLEEVASEGSLGEGDLRDLARGQAALFDRLLAYVTEEYARGVEERFSSSEERRRVRIQRLLAGELLETSDLAYDFSAYHLGIVATGPEAAKAVRALERAVGCRVLVTQECEGPVWAWLGNGSPLDPDHVRRALSSSSQTLSIGLGEAAHDLGGWRLTHRQARAAHFIAKRSGSAITRYVEVALLASASQDNLLTESLREIYLEPLGRERNRGAAARQTLVAYFAANRNISSAAAALGLSRRTVTNRLQMIERHLGCSLQISAVTLEVALKLAELQEQDELSAQSRKIT